MRKLIYAVVGLAVLLIAAVVIAVLVVDLNQYKGEIEAEVESATGRDVTLGGDIHVTFWPSIGAAVDDVEIANAAGGSPEPMVRAETLQVVVAIAPLLSGNVQVESIRIVKPTILVETLADGSSNLELAAEQNVGGTATGSSGGGPSTPVQIDRIDVVDGTVIYRDLAAGSEERVENINLSAQARTLQGPFQADGSLMYKGLATTFAVDIGNMNRPNLPVSLRLGLNGDAARVTFNGQLSGLDTAPMAGGSLLIQADSLDAILSSFVAGLPDGAKALTDQAFELDAQLVADATSVNLADLALSLGDIRATGDVTVETEEGTRIDVALAANHLDADMLLQALAEAESGAVQGGGSGTEEAGGTESGEAPSEGGEPEDAVPHDLAISADLSVDAVTYNDNVVRQLHVIATLDDGILALEQLGAGLPGGTSLAVAGRIENYLSEPSFRGQVELASDNARALLDWLQVALPDVPAERLRRVDLFASVSAESGVVALTDMDLSLDSTRMTGTFAADWTGVPTVIADIAVDRINLDAYLAPTAAGTDSAGSAQSGTSDSDEETTAPLGLPPMPEINADIKARVASLTYNEVAVSNLLVDGLLQDGGIELRNLAADVADASVRAAGVIDPATSTVSVRYALEAPNLGSLSRLVAVDLPVSPQDLGAVNLTGSVEGDMASADLVQRLETALGTASIDGTLSDPMGQPGFKGRVGLRSDSYIKLARAFGTEVEGINDSAIAFAADVDTDGNDADFNAVLEAVGATLRASGKLAGLAAAPSYDVRAKLEHAELAELLKAIGADMGTGNLGPVDVTVTAKGDDKALNGQLVSSTIGPSTLNGTLEAKLDGVRPYLDLRLQGDTLALDPFLAAGSGGTVGDAGGSGGGSSGGSSGAERWSSEPLDLSALRTFDGRVQITGNKVTLQDMVFTDPVIVATVSDGTLQLEQFRGGAFDGEFRLTGTVTEGSPHKMTFDVNVSDADAKQLLQHFADTDAVRGRLFVTSKVGAEGMSQRELVSNLDGDASLSMKDGVMEGFDLPRISERLDNLDNEAAVVALLADATSGGETEFTEVEGTFDITEGIARSDDLRAIMEAGAARFTMVADLPRWLIDLNGVMELTEHENSPKIRVALNGPIDNPERTIDTRELQAFLVTRLVESAIRNYGDGEGGGEGVQDLLNVLTGNQGASDEGEAQQPQAEAEGEAATEEAAPQLDEPNQEMNAETLLNILTDTQGTAGQGETSEPTAPAEEVAPAEETEATTAEPAQEEQPQELDAQTLFNILTGSQGNAGEQQQEQPAQAEEQQQQEQQQQQQLDTEQLLQNLLQGSN